VPAVEASSTGFDVTAVRRSWPGVLERLAGLRRTSWTLVSQNAQVAAVDGARLTLAFSSAGLRDAFAGGAHPSTSGRRSSTSSASTGRSRPSSIPPQAAVRRRVHGQPVRRRRRLDRSVRRREARPGRPAGVTATGRQPAHRHRNRPATGTPPPRHQVRSAGRRRAAAGVRRRSAVARSSRPGAPVAPEDDVASVDDPDLEDGGLGGAALVERMLGAKVIGEFDST
jgi:DNA polymerase-3 subunit gamma/tau